MGSVLECIPCSAGAGMRLIIAAVLAALVLAAAVSTHNKIYNKGFAAHKKIADAEKAKAVLEANAARDKALARSAELAKKLLEQEGKVTYVTQEVIKYVPKVTSGKPCLSPDAVRLLNTRPGDSDKAETGPEPAPKSPAAPSASDTDIAYWISNANGLYSVCAARLNALIDYELN